MKDTIFPGGNPWKQLIIFGGLLIVSLILTVFGVQLLTLAFYGMEVYSQAAGFKNLDNEMVLSATLFMQAISQIGIFILPSIVFFGVFKTPFYHGLGLSGRKVWPGILFAMAVVFLALPFTGLLYEWNSAMALPTSLKYIEDWMHTAEQSAHELTMAFVSAKDLSGLGVNLIVMALIPAFAEELLFRGVLQQLIARISGRKVLAVWVTAFLFSAIHLQFFGFLPRFLLGLIMGYLYLWSGSIWLPIAAHFANNAGAVVAGYLFATGYSNIPFDEVGTMGGWMPALLSLFSIIAVLIYFRSTHRKEKEYLSAFSDPSTE